MPMLDDEEYAVARELFRDGMRATKEFRAKWGISLEHASLEDRYRPLLEFYERVTGFKETNPNAVWHHCIAQYGPPCGRCGKPLRTPKAKLCGACMWPVAAE
jgi:hypothetical protein